MANKFEFRNTTTILNICNQEFRVDNGDLDFIENADHFRNQCILLAEEVRKAGDKKEPLLQWCNEVKVEINHLLGDQAYEKIFADRKVNILDHVDLMMFIINELNAAQTDQ